MVFCTRCSQIPFADRQAVAEEDPRIIGQAGGQHTDQSGFAARFRTEHFFQLLRCRAVAGEERTREAGLRCKIRANFAESRQWHHR